MITILNLLDYLLIAINKGTNLSPPSPVVSLSHPCYKYSPPEYYRIQSQQQGSKPVQDISRDWKSISSSYLGDEDGIGEPIINQCYDLQLLKHAVLQQMHAVGCLVTPSLSANQLILAPLQSSVPVVAHGLPFSSFGH